MALGIQIIRLLAPLQGLVPLLLSVKEAARAVGRRDVEARPLQRREIGPTIIIWDAM